MNIYIEININILYIEWMNKKKQIDIKMNTMMMVIMIDAYYEFISLSTVTLSTK